MLCSTLIYIFKPHHLILIEKKASGSYQCKVLMSLVLSWVTTQSSEHLPRQIARQWDQQVSAERSSIRDKSWDEEIKMKSLP